MPDYRTYSMNEKGELVEQPPEKLAEFLGVSEYDANLLIRGMNLTKTICTIAGQMETPPLIWNKNMPKSLVDVVSNHVIDKLKGNPAWSIKEFDWSLIYDDNDNLKYTD